MDRSNLNHRHRKGEATSIYKPSLQVAVPRWSPDGKSIAFIEGLMSDQGFHGGDLFTISADGHDILNRTGKRKSSISSLFWLTPDRILVTEVVGGGSAISESTLSDNGMRTIWNGAEHIHAFGNFPNFSLSKDGKIAAAARSSYEMPPEIWAGSTGEWRQLTKNNTALSPSWGKAENLTKANEGFKFRYGCLVLRGLNAGRNTQWSFLFTVVGPSSATMPEWPASFGMARAIVAALSSRGYYVLAAQSPAEVMGREKSLPAQM